MRYRVFWSPDAERELESLASSVADPSELAASARRIDQQLIRHPLRFGESRDQELRIAFESPLAILFDVFQEERTVVVYRVWRIG